MNCELWDKWDKWDKQDRCDKWDKWDEQDEERIVNYELGTSCKLAPAGVFEDVERIGRRIDESIVNPYILNNSE